MEPELIFLCQISQFAHHCSLWLPCVKLTKYKNEITVKITIVLHQLLIECGKKCNSMKVLIISIWKQAAKALIDSTDLCISSTMSGRRRSSATWFWLGQNRQRQKQKVCTGPGWSHRCSAERDTSTVGCALQTDSYSTWWWQHENTAGKDPVSHALLLNWESKLGFGLGVCFISCLWFACAIFIIRSIHRLMSLT